LIRHPRAARVQQAKRGGPPARPEKIETLRPAGETAVVRGSEAFVRETLLRRPSPARPEKVEALGPAG